jgi:divalent metal cation (Fe/Co/Zn/Cd) transporter
VYAFVVAIILFSVGGVFSLYEGIAKFQHPEPLQNWWLPLTVLAIAIVLESFSLRTAVRESNRARGQHGWISFIRRAKQPELPVILLEDVAALLGLTFALLGVGLTVLTENPIFDGIGTLFIGALLVSVAVVLGIETKSLLVGEGANPEDLARIRRALDEHALVERIIHMKTLYLGPDELLVAAKLAFPTTSRTDDVARAVDSVEAAIREAVPHARMIYLESDVWRAARQDDIAPPTDLIVIKGAD